MPPVDERFTDLPPTTKAFLRTISEQEIVHLKNMARFYENLSDRPHVLRWLQEAREDEIDLLDDGIKLVRAANTVGKFLWWAIATLIAAIILGSQVGEWLNKIGVFFSRGVK